jgi:alpha-glucuronidase
VRRSITAPTDVTRDGRQPRAATLARAGLVIGLLAGSVCARAEDGYDLWLRYPPVSGAQLAEYRAAATELVAAAGGSPTLEAARAELARGVRGLLGREPQSATRVTQDGALVIGTPRSLPLLATLPVALERAGSEGYVILRRRIAGHRAIVVAANTDRGVLYGVFGLLRLMQTHRSLAILEVSTEPHVEHRVLDHWDNPDGSIERGYAGASLWDWQRLPGHADPRYTDYARACASLGINGSVLNNVNASPLMLTPLYLAKVAALAGVLRPYGVRVYLSVPFSAPVTLGGLASADPQDAAVRTWWHAKVDEIYARIPDFGGFLVKANSEGQPGPQDYGRSHAEGANLLADALAPRGGIVMWRAFVYSSRAGEDRAAQAYQEFKPLDGRFHANVLLQVKNGPIDFQPREPFHPLFGAMPGTPLMLEVQITKEYLGFATHLAYLGPLFAEVLDSDTYARGPGSTVARVVDGSLFGAPLSGMAGVANVGAARNWSGSQFDQANWYAFGRLAWDPGSDPRAIAEDWVRMTFSNEPTVVTTVVDMMMGSRETVVSYMTPLGLAHIMASGHHYGPAPWLGEGSRTEWTSAYYHRADASGIGFDRTVTGSNAVAQYADPVAATFADPARTPVQLLLWFHHLSWDYRLPAGRTLWEELISRYDQGVAAIAAMRAQWASLAGHIDPERYGEVSAFLAIQEREARWWRDACIAYFQSVSGRALPAGAAPPAHPLSYYQALCFPFAPGDPAGAPHKCGPTTPRELPSPDD